MAENGSIGTKGESGRAKARVKKRLEKSLEWIEKTEPKNLSPMLIRSMISDMHTRQIELEIQNDELMSKQKELLSLYYRYSDFYDKAPVSCATMHESGRLLEINAAAASLLGIPREGLDSRYLSSFILPEDLPLLEACKKTLVNESLLQSCELRMVRQDGIPFKARLDIFKARDGTIILIIRALRDKAPQDEKGLKRLKLEDLLIKELRHRIKNQLNCIISLVDLRLMEHGNPSEASVLMETKSSLFAMESLYDALGRTDNDADISLLHYFLELAENILAMYPMKRIKLNAEFDDFTLKAPLLFPLGLIISEIVTNSMKYAFAGRKTGSISFFASKAENKVTIRIEDDGPGMATPGCEADLRRDAKSAAYSSGQGLQLISALAEQIGGSLRQVPANGTCYVIEFSV